PTWPGGSWPAATGPPVSCHFESTGSTMSSPTTRSSAPRVFRPTSTSTTRRRFGVDERCDGPDRGGRGWPGAGPDLLAECDRARAPGVAPATDRLQPGVEQCARPGAGVLPVSRHPLSEVEHLRRPADRRRDELLRVDDLRAPRRGDPADRR